MAELCRMSQTVEEIVKKPKISRTDSMDPASQLPDHLLHSIFSYLRGKDLVRASLVSKNWHRNTPSHVALNFDESRFFKDTPVASQLQPRLHKHNNFLDWLRSSLQIETSLKKAEKRILRLQFSSHENIYGVMRMMDQEYDFHEVYLIFGGYFFNNLPYIFQSTYLTILHLTCCQLDEHVLHGVTKFVSLQELKLDGVQLSGETLTKFITKCPYIKELRMKNCMILTFVVLPKLNHLEKLYVEQRSAIINIQVIAPSLQVFHYIDRCVSSMASACTMDIRSCRMLREFHLECFKFPVGLGHQNFCLGFPHLESLFIGRCVTWKRVNILSPSLRNLTLMFTELYNKSRRSVISAPKLCSFQYTGRTFKSYLAPDHDSTKLLEPSCIKLVPQMEKINRAWFLQLRTHLKKFSNCTALAIFIGEENTATNMSCIDKRVQRWNKLSGRRGVPMQPLHHIEQLKLYMRFKVPQESHGNVMKYIFDNLLWMSHPNILTLSIPTSFTALALGVCKKLLSRGEGNCCSDTQQKCWRHFLKKFVIKELEVDNKHKLTKLIVVLSWYSGVLLCD